jgi:hypothetical protein
MIVWRVQNSNGEGPYNAGLNISDELNAAHRNEEHPIPMNDGIPCMFYGEIYSDCGTPKYYCSGFRTKKELKVWFDGWLEKLQNRGFSITKLKVPKKSVHLGKKQLTFLSSDAKSVSTC